MPFDLFTNVIFLWVSRYIAGFCLVSIVLWATGSYLWSRNWQQRVRDSGIFFLVVGVLTLLLLLRPEGTDAVLWPPITWFCFSMLIVMELLWISFLVEMIYHSLHHHAASNVQRAERSRSGPSRYTRNYRSY